MFQLQYFGPISTGQNSAFTINYTSQTATSLGAQNAFSYNGLAAGEAIATLLAADYFLPIVTNVELGDFVFVSATDGNATLYVSAIAYPDNGGNNATITLSIADAGTTFASSQFISLQNMLLATGGTWTMTRLAQGNYGIVHSVGADTSRISIDVTPSVRAGSGEGFELQSIDFIYSIGTAALLSHSATLNQIVYTNNMGNAVTAIPTTGSLATAARTNPYVTNVTVTTPVFLNAPDAKYVVELSVQTDASTTYTLYGIVVHFNQELS